MAEYDLDKIVSNIIDANDSTWNPHEKIPLITEQIERIKADTESYLTSNDIDVASLLEEAEELNAEGMQLVEDMEACKVDIVEVTTSEMTKYMENYYLMAQEIYGNYYVINIVNDVLKYVTYINDYSRAKDERRYTNAVEALSGFARDIESPIDGMENLHVYINAKGLVKAGYGVLYETLAKEWEKMITCQTSTLNDELVITIALPVTETPATADILAALLLSNKIDEYVSNFANFILKEALIPIIEKQCRVEIRDEIELVVHVPTKGDDKPDFPTVMNNLETVFRFLETRLNIIYHENENKNFITTVGDCIKADFCEHLINNCFVQTIPHNLNDLHDYSTITAKIENFYDFLIKSNFIKSSDNISLLKYMAEFDVLFAERSSDYYLDAARKIMLKDLSITMSIGVESIPKAEESAMCDDDVDVQAQACQIITEMIPTSLFYFPRCMISRSAQELLDLVYVVMEQAVQCPDVVCKKLYVTVRLIFELYDAVVPYHHENFLQTIPQYVALFHNNCMYLAHNLMLLGEKWMNHMGERQVNYPVSFLDLVPKMRELGYKHLTIHMQQQRKQILDNIRSSDLNCIDVKDVLDENAEAAVRQCLRQLQLLKNVWIGVFPHNVFTRLMATLVNMFIDELIHRVCTVEDISMEMAVQLTDMYTLVAQKAPGLFQKQNDIEKEVKSWSKLQELIFVLGASLKDIESHWGDGSGPLAKHFRIEEIRSLIKALFQNTQYRANLISKIK